MLGGTNGSVRKVEPNNYDRSLTVAGAFTKLNDLPCLNVGVYKDDQLSCLGSGVAGVIHDVIHNPDGVYIFGELLYEGDVYPGARFDGSEWDYLSVPTRLGATSTSAYTNGRAAQFSVLISHASIPGYQEIWQYLGDGGWVKKARVRGVILDMATSSYGVVHVGHLDSVVIYGSNAEVDTTLMVNNLLFDRHNSEEWYGAGNEISDTVKVAVSVGGALILGGACSNQPGANGICISRYYNSTLQPLVLNDFSLSARSINAIAYTSGSKFVFGGDFEYQPGIGTYGSHLATYDLAHNFVEPLAILDHAVNTLTYHDGELFIGGAFQSNSFSHDMNFLARQAVSVGVGDLTTAAAIKVYPNPFVNSIQLKGVENGSAYSISKIDGRTLKNGQVTNGTVDDLAFLPSGMFLLRIESPNELIVKKILK